MKKLAFAAVAGLLMCGPASALILVGSDEQQHFVELPGSCEAGGCLVLGGEAAYLVSLDESTGALTVCGFAGGFGVFEQGTPTTFHGGQALFSDCAFIAPETQDGGNFGFGAAEIVLFGGTPSETPILVFGDTVAGPDEAPGCVSVTVVFPDGTPLEVGPICLATDS